MVLMYGCLVVISYGVGTFLITRIKRKENDHENDVAEQIKYE